MTNWPKLPKRGPINAKTTMIVPNAAKWNDFKWDKTCTGSVMEAEVGKTSWTAGTKKWQTLTGNTANRSSKFNS